MSVCPIKDDVKLDHLVKVMSDVEHLFMCLLPMCMSSLEKCLFSYLVHFFDWVVYSSGIKLQELLVCFRD